MNIPSIQDRLSSFSINNTSLSQIQNKPAEIFASILQEKMSTLQNLGFKTSTSVAQDNAQDADVLPNDLYLSDTLTGNQQVLQSLGSNAASGCLQCAIENSTAASAYGASSLPTTTGLSSADLQKAAPYMDYINEASQRYGMPVNLILGIMKAESNFNNSCVSYAGAKGLMQLMPETAAEVGVTDVFDSRQNILGSVEYVTKLINRYDGDVRLALAAYNTGPGKISRRGVTSSNSAEYYTVPQSIRDYADRVLRYAGYQD